jgi:hypothetical protein
MGLGAYLASVTERDHFLSEEKREKAEVETKPEAEKAEIHDILSKYGIGQDACEMVVRDLECNPDNWVQVRDSVQPYRQRFVLITTLLTPCHSS